MYPIPNHCSLQSALDRDVVLPSPIEAIEYKLPVGVRLHIKREDLIHPQHGGNKWRKLKYNLQAYLRGGYTELVTFGGAFSNHIAATASICADYGITSVGIIRGTYSDPANPTLINAQQHGMQIHHIPKDAYRLKEESTVFRELISRYSSPYIIPEGGSNQLALTGVSEIVTEIRAQEEQVEHIFVAAGTGTTAAGIINNLEPNQFLHVIAVLKHAGLDADIRQRLSGNKTNWKVYHDYHHGGYARVSGELISFINEFKKETGIPLDPIYTGKMMYAIYDLLGQESVSEHLGNMLAIHTGGLQGITGYNYMNKDESLALR